MNDVTRIPGDITRGKASADELLPLVYDELRRVAAATSDGSVTLWNTLDATELDSHPLPGLGRPFGTVELSPNLRFAAYATESGSLRVVELHTQRILWTTRATEETLRTIRFSPDNSRLATGAWFTESLVRIWDAATGSELARLDGHKGWISDLAFWPDGQRLASASADQTIRLWDLSGLGTSPPPESPNPAAPSTSELKPNLPTPPPSRELAVLRGHQLEVWSLALAPNPGTLFSGSKDGSILVWDTSVRRRDRSPVSLPEPVRTWSFTADSSAIRSLTRNDQVVRWQGPDSQDRLVEVDLELELPGPNAPFGPQALFSNDGRLLVVATRENHGLQVWDLERRAPAANWQSTGSGLLPLGFLGASHRLLTRRLHDGAIEEWDLDAATRIRTWSLPQARAAGPFLAVSQDARWWIVPGDPSQTVLHDAAEHHHELLTLPATGAKFQNPTFSPDGSRLAAHNARGTLFIWTATPHHPRPLEPRRCCRIPHPPRISGVESVPFPSNHPSPVGVLHRRTISRPSVIVLRCSTPTRSPDRPRDPEPELGTHPLRPYPSTAG